jgi:hypothetical protein
MARGRWSSPYHRHLDRAPEDQAMAAGWNFADLEADQVALVAEAERTLDTDLVVAYRPSPWGSVDPDTVGDGLDPAQLEPSQLECLQGLERMVGGVLVAYRRKID